MRYIIPSIILAIIVFGCTSNNEEDYYFSDDSDTTSNPGSLIAHIPIDGAVTDITDNLAVNLYGEAKYTEGIDGNPQGAILLDGQKDFILAFLDQYDSLSISLWFNREDVMLDAPKKPVLIDYSSNQVTTYLDGVSGETYLITNMNEETEESSSWVNSYFDWCHLYIEITENDVNIAYNGWPSSGGIVDFKDEYTPAAALNLQGDQLYIGRASKAEDLVNSYFDGAIDDIRIYSRFLSAGEINQLRNNRTTN